MEINNKGLAVIFHSSSFDRVYHGVSIALAALALGRQVRFFFSYWALEYLKKQKTPLFKLDAEAQEFSDALKRHIKKGNLLEINEAFNQAKSMGAKFYACTNSMSLLNISRDELIDITNKSMGITTFLTETKEDQILFI